MVLRCVPASEIGITFLLLEMENVTVLYTGPLLLPCVYPGEVPLGPVVYAAVELAKECSEGVVSQARDCSSAGKQAVCAKRSGHRSWKMRPNPFAVGLRRLML